MKSHYNQRAMVGIPLGATLVAAALVLAIGRMIPIGGSALLFSIGYAIYLWGCAELAKAKGYTAAQGVVIGIVLTALALLILPDRSKMSRAEREAEDRDDEADRKAEEERRPLTKRQKGLAWFFGLVFVTIGLALIVGYEIYWARVVVPEREGMATAVTVSADKPDPKHDGKLVHVTGALAGAEQLADPEFGVAVDALRLRRRVWMRQWEQGGVQSKSSYSTEDTATHKKTTLLKTKTYSYTPVWSEEVINSRSFHDSGHDNPTAKTIPDRAVTAAQVSLGGFAVGPELVKQLDNFQSATLSAANLAGLAQPLRAKAQLADGEIYVGPDPRQPAIGDLKVKIEFAPATDVTVLAQQDGRKLVPYAVAKSGSIAQLRVGTLSVQEMIGQFIQGEIRTRIVVWVFGSLALLVGGIIIAVARKPSRQTRLSRARN
jgi:hypothetical protein